MALYETREQWGATGNPGGSPVGQRSELIVHHAYSPHVPANVSAAYERDTVRAIERYHEDTRGWSDIAYTFLIFQSGRAYEGRGWFHSGAHTKGRNEEPAFCFVINGDEHAPTDKAWETARELAAEGIQVGALTSDYTLSGHADYSTKSCPGEKTYPIIGEHLSSSLVVAAGNDIEEANMPISDADARNIARHVWKFEDAHAEQSAQFLVRNAYQFAVIAARREHDGQVDVDELADALRESLGDEIAEAIGARLVR